MKKLLLAVAAGAMATLSVATLAGATPACVTTLHWNTEGINLNVKADPGQGLSNATAVVKAEGVEITTPDTPAKAQFLVNTNELLSTVTQISYKTKQLNGAVVALPAYHLVLDYNGAEGGGFTTLVFEPYQQPGFVNDVNVWKTWPATSLGDSKWWSTKPLNLLPGNAQQGSEQKLSAILEKYPAAVVQQYGWNMGSANDGAHAVVDKLTFGTNQGCTIHQWTLSASPSPSVSTSPSPRKTVIATATPRPTRSEAVPTLPVTGVNAPMVAGFGAALALAGVVVLVATRKRRNRVTFTNE